MSIRFLFIPLQTGVEKLIPATMIEYLIKIVGAQFAANPDYKFCDQETDEICARTIAMLSELRDMKPRVVLRAEPTNPRDPKAIMARSMGRKIGYVCREQLDLVHSILSQSKRGMLAGDIDNVVVYKHGYLFIILKCNEPTDILPLNPDINWNILQTDFPLLPETEDMQTEEETSFMLEEELLPRLEDVNLTQLQTYLGWWMDSTCHDLSDEASRRREAYIKQLDASKRDEVRRMADELKHQCTRMCSRHQLEERTREWWPSLVDSEEADRMWNTWLVQTDGQLLDGLRLIDATLRQLPGKMYQDIGRMEVVFSRLYYHRIPREYLVAILSLLILREKTCRELGIDMKPMTEADYSDFLSETSKYSMEDMGKAFLSFPAKIALGLYGHMSTLMAEHPAWQKYAPKIHKDILKKQDGQDEKQDKMIDYVKKAANKPTTQNIYGDKNEFKEDSKMLKLTLPADADPAEIAMRIAERQKQIEKKDNYE